MFALYGTAWDGMAWRGVDRRLVLLLAFAFAFAPAFTFTVHVERLTRGDYHHFMIMNLCPTKHVLCFIQYSMFNDSTNL